MVCLFIGQDSPSKDIELARLKQELFTKELEQFNLDILYAKELNLIRLQERLSSLPVRAKKRMIVIKDAQGLKSDIKEFFLKYVKMPAPGVAVVLDINRQDPKDAFINSLARSAKIYRFKEPVYLDTFALSRQMALRRPDYALKVLNQLLKNGEKPERILGGLRYVWERDAAGHLETRKRLKLLLRCDIDIKTGKLKAQFALERLIVSLCGLAKPFR